MMAGTAAAVAAPSILAAEAASSAAQKEALTGETAELLIKERGLPITGAFLDEISHDIPHQNWGLAEWGSGLQKHEGYRHRYSDHDPFGLS